MARRWEVDVRPAYGFSVGKVLGGQMSMLTDEQNWDIVVRTAWSQYLSDGTQDSLKRYRDIVKERDYLYPPSDETSEGV